MSQFTRTAVTFGVLVILIFGLYAFANWFSKTTGYVLGEDEKVKLAQCLNLNEDIFYTSSTCPMCDTQLELFGSDASKFLEVVTCTGSNECPNGGVPAWRISGQVVYGIKSFKELSELSGCALDE